ncbi:MULTISPECIES: hypothetical protein [unclassified Chelatococcus]|uniref:hypothetical protein n=1 Tax=unclassified Chelatococcus TaxID=2638111 RepID=UPI001BD1A31E|nr:MULTISPECIES: hypothetical protein [unclassified Chelatococcus]MBS7697576.1 hypothetical protein [Chelatococcus sp. YT9]MBX3559960.1 hypothetical protein [Chelatococcus sp.]
MNTPLAEPFDGFAKIDADYWPVRVVGITDTDMLLVIAEDLLGGRSIHRVQSVYCTDPTNWNEGARRMAR